MGQMVGNPKVTVIPARPRMGIGRKNDERQKIRVAAYCRVSTDSDEQATSYEAQIEHYTAWASKPQIRKYDKVYNGRANYNDLKNGVHETTEYLELFLRNLLLDEKNELHNRTMHISGRFAEVDIERVKVDIKSREVDIESTKVDIRNKLLSFSDTISEKTINHTVEIFSKCGKENCFGRTIVEEITGLKPSRASKLIKLLVDSEVIVPVTGHGKGKYRFQ